MTPKRARRKFPQLQNNEIKYCPIFYEGTHDDARTNLAVAQTAAMEGACIVNYCDAISLLRTGSGGANGSDVRPSSTGSDSDSSTATAATAAVGNSGKVVGARVKDMVSGKEFDVRAKSVLFCGGPFTDELRRLEDPQAQGAINGASGIHIVLPAYFAPSDIGLVDMNTSDGRFMFFLPWKNHVLVGTTDHGCKPTMRPVPDESVRFAYSHYHCPARA
jgi:glycerol-3-phosphate dehydrogenase